MAAAEKLLKCWCRVSVQKNKSLKDVADETGNMQAMKLLNKYDKTCEVALSAFACDVERVKDLLKLGTHSQIGIYVWLVSNLN